MRVRRHVSCVAAWLVWMGAWLGVARADADLQSLDAARQRLAKAEQVLVVTAQDWNSSRGTLVRMQRTRPQGPLRRIGRPLVVWLGRSGMGLRSDGPPPGGLEAARGPSAHPVKQEGDGRSPAGLFELGELWGEAKTPPPNTRLSYRQAQEEDRCVDDVAHPQYGQLTRAPAQGPEPWKSAEHLRLPTAHYRLFMVIKYNMPEAPEQPRRGAGSCIFLHIAPPAAAAADRATAGCTALEQADLQDLLAWLDRRKHPLLVQLPKEALRQASKAWGVALVP
jgi:D-alanyl-D-alanine dipeptidase